MLRSTTATEHRRKWADAREMQMAIGQQRRDKNDLPQESRPNCQRA